MDNCFFAYMHWLRTFHKAREEEGSVMPKDNGICIEFLPKKIFFILQKIKFKVLSIHARQNTTEPSL